MVLLIVFSVYITASADNSSLVYVDKVTLVSGEPILIPVKIQNNGGIMGFKITVEYNSAELELLSVTKGEITTAGNFSTNLGKKDSAVDIVWNNTSEIKGDGTLFIISAKTKQENLAFTELNFSYSQPDTFNEAYEDVVLDCGSFMLSADSSQSSLPDAGDTSDIYVNESDTPDSTQILEAVDLALDKYGYDNISEVENETQFVIDVNDYLSTFAGSDAPTAGSLSDVKQIYESALSEHFGEEIKNNLSEKQITDAVASSLETVKADSVFSVSEKDRQAFIQNFYNNVKSYSDDIPDITGKMSDEAAIEAIASLLRGNDSETESPSGIRKVTVIITAVIVAVIAVVTVVVIVILKKKKSVTDN